MADQAPTDTMYLSMQQYIDPALLLTADRPATTDPLEPLGVANDAAATAPTSTVPPPGPWPEA